MSGWIALPTLPSFMSSEFLVLMLALVTVITRGFVGFRHRSLLGRHLPGSMQDRGAAQGYAMMMFGCGYLGFMALNTINKNSSTAGQETALAFVMMGYVSYLFAVAVLGFNKWVVTDLVAQTLMEIGLLGLIAALGVIVIEGNPDDAILRNVAILMVVCLWAVKHLDGILNSTTRYSVTALEHPGPG